MGTISACISLPPKAGDMQNQMHSQKKAPQRAICLSSKRSDNGSGVIQIGK
jgi:hypothetical protein